jgi:hypothetical protein
LIVLEFLGIKIGLLREEVERIVVVDDDDDTAFVCFD